jgi:hypothetical protein
MGAHILRATALAAVTSCLGYLLLSYRKRHALHQQRAEQREALQQWESDGGAAPARPAASGSPAATDRAPDLTSIS